MWKNAQWPRSRIIFSLLELGIKIACFMQTYPPRFEFYDACHIGQSFLKIHTILLSLLYGLLSFLFILFYCCTCTYIHPVNRITSSRHLVATISPSNATISPSNATITAIAIIDDQTECCICLDKTAQSWSALPCGHTFHHSCILTWINYRDSCPICRTHIT